MSGPSWSPCKRTSDHRWYPNEHGGDRASHGTSTLRKPFETLNVFIRTVCITIEWHVRDGMPATVTYRSSYR